MSQDEMITKLRKLYPNVIFEKGQWGAIVIIHEDMEILNPRLSSCGRFDVDGSDYGITLDAANEILEFNSAIIPENERLW